MHIHYNLIALEDATFAPWGKYLLCPRPVNDNNFLTIPSFPIHVLPLVPTACPIPHPCIHFSLRGHDHHHCPNKHVHCVPEECFIRGPFHKWCGCPARIPSPGTSEESQCVSCPTLAGSVEHMGDQVSCPWSPSTTSTRGNSPSEGYLSQMMIKDEVPLDFAALIDAGEAFYDADEETLDCLD